MNIVVLIVSLCTGPSMDDCQIYSLASAESHKVCEELKPIAESTLKKEGYEHFRLACVSDTNE